MCVVPGKTKNISPALFQLCLFAMAPSVSTKLDIVDKRIYQNFAIGKNKPLHIMEKFASIINISSRETLSYQIELSGRLISVR